MFSHVVIFWTKPEKPTAPEELIAGANQFLKPIPGILSFHIGKMVGSHRPVLIFKSGFCQTILLPKQFVTDNFCFLFTNWLPRGKNVVCHWK